jgi:hypothetical protein
MKPIAKTLFFVLLLGVTNLVSAQTTISGNVAEKKSPLICVSITLKDTYDGATTDASGKYSFKT